MKATTFCFVLGGGNPTFLQLNCFANTTRASSVWVGGTRRKTARASECILTTPESSRFGLLVRSSDKPIILFLALYGTSGFAAVQLVELLLSRAFGAARCERTSLTLRSDDSCMWLSYSCQSSVEPMRTTQLNAKILRRCSVLVDLLEIRRALGLKARGSKGQTQPEPNRRGFAATCCKFVPVHFAL